MSSAQSAMMYDQNHLDGEVSRARAAGRIEASTEFQARIGDLQQKAFLEGQVAGREESGREWAQERARLVAAAAENSAPEVQEKIVSIERTRILSIQSMMDRGFEGVARDAINQGATVEQFAMLQLQAMRDRGITLDAIRRDAPPAADHCPPPNGDRVARTPKKIANELFDRRAQAAKDSAASCQIRR